MLTKRVPFFGVVSLVALGLSATPARADLYGFIPISHNSGSEADVVARQLSFSVTQDESDASKVLFTFTNSGPMPSTIKGVYFDDGAGVIGSQLPPINGPGVSFVSDGTPDHLSAPSAYQFDDFWATAKNPAGLGKKGVDVGEWVTIPFTLAGEKTFDDLVRALDLGAADPTVAERTLRVGIHVGSIGTSGQSDAFIDPPTTVVPLPGAFLLGMLGLSAAGWRLRKSA